MIVVVPPQAAARVPVSKVSAENVPPNGISMCVCASIPPGSTYLPVASITWSAASAAAFSPASPSTARASTAAILSPATSTSASRVPDAVTTVPPLMRMVLTALSPGSLALAGGSWLYQRLVLVRAAVAVELPLVPDLGQLVHVEVADHYLVGVVGGRVAHQLAARVDEVGLAVEVVVAQVLDADPVDRADEVLVGHRGGGLLEPPQVLGQAAAGSRRVEHDRGPGQAERSPALGEVPVVADVHADPARRGVEDRVAHVAGAEVELLPEALDLRDVGLAVLAQVLAVGVDHRRGVVVDARVLFLVHRRDDDDAVLPGHVLEELGRRAVGDRFGVGVVVRVLHLAEVRPVEEFLQADHLRASRGGGLDMVHRCRDHRFLVAGPALLDKPGPDDLRHRSCPPDDPRKAQSLHPGGPARQPWSPPRVAYGRTSPAAAMSAPAATRRCSAEPAPGAAAGSIPAPAPSASSTAPAASTRVCGRSTGGREPDSARCVASR